MTTSETISQFAARTRVRVAINGNFFAPCCDHFAEPKTTIGLLVSNGKVVSPASTDPTQSEAVLAITTEDLPLIIGCQPHRWKRPTRATTTRRRQR